MKTRQMTGADVCAWLDEMRAAGHIKSDAECARLMRISANAMVVLKQNGCDTRTALAFASLKAFYTSGCAGVGAIIGR